jgi:hypothetical protein
MSIPIPASRLFRSTRSSDGKSSADVDELTPGSTLGLSPRQVQQKHTFLEPSWVQPLNSLPNIYSSDPSQVHQETSAKEFCKFKYRPGDIMQSPHYHKRYKFDIASMNPYSKSYLSRCASKGYISQAEATRTRRLSASDFTLNMNKSGKLLHKTPSSESIDATECRYGNIRNNIQYNENNFF